jgi:hypothetical protein
MSLVVSLKLVFVVQESKEDDCLFQRELDLVVGFLLVSGPSNIHYRVTYRFGTLL